MNEEDITAAILTKLQSLTGDGNPLVGVYSEHKTDLPGYPVATFEYEKEHITNGSTAENEHHYFFDIVLHQEMENVGRESALTIMASLCTTVKHLFENDYTLDGSVHYCLPSDIVKGEYQEGAGWVMYRMITLECVVLKSLN